MEKLPTEIVREILGHSEPKELKMIRVAFAHNPYGATWVEVGANLLFRRIYFSAGPQAMLRFQNIIETKRLQMSVRHLVVVDIQLNEDLVDDKARFRSALPRAVTMSRVQVNQTYQRYCRVFKEWQKILDDGEDVALLSKGLNALPNVDKISVIGGPSHDHGTRSYLEIGPHATDFHGIGASPSYWAFRRARGHHRWDRRPLQNLFRSLCVVKVRPTKVEIGDWWELSSGTIRRTGVPISCLNLDCGLGNAMFDTVIITAFANVMDLTLQIDMNPRPYDPNRQYTEKDLGVLFEVLPSLRCLQRLTLGFIYRTLLESETKRLLKGNKWADLTFLSVHSFEISPTTFTAFVQNHTSTLTEISLDRVGLPSSSQDTWETLIARNKPFLNLKDANFYVYEFKRPRPVPSISHG